MDFIYYVTIYYLIIATDNSIERLHSSELLSSHVYFIFLVLMVRESFIKKLTPLKKELDVNILKSNLKKSREAPK